MVIDSHQKRFIMNTQLRQCFARAKPFRVKKIKKKSQILTGIFDFQKSQLCQKSLNFKIWFQKFQSGNPARSQRLHETTTVTVGRGSCCVTRPGIGPPWQSEEIRTVRFAVFLQFSAYYLILLDLQLINFPRACTISREVPSRFSHFLQPWWSGAKSSQFQRKQASKFVDQKEWHWNALGA